MNPPPASPPANGRPGLPARPMSPCMSVCAIATDGYCSGCLRTLDEIARWAAMSAAEQWQVMSRLDERRVLRDGPSPQRR